ncbi:hypothetical protein [Paracoccus sediminicola]|uniref:hypothetical protein n=1 Tax=Paracoccus sediminicola TaxID=3017783 RepID=UPI0022F0C5DD|nr:hypothetical protein [Paracoccus sediminicola]WBU56774.1 hypothetical protein PAF18_15090 [Paracoccus sediminicola]
MMRILLAFLLLASPAVAQSVGDCDARVSARSLPEPWEDHTAVYANGDVRVAVIDTLEPAAAAVHLMVLSPPLSEIGDRQCRLVSLSRAEGGAASGFFNIDFAGRSADYDPARGLVLDIPVETFRPETGMGAPATLNVTINQSTGDVTAEVTAP